MFPVGIPSGHDGKRRQKGSQDGVGVGKVTVAVRAEKHISKTALSWAFTHLVRPGDCVTLLAVSSDDDRGWRTWKFPRFIGGGHGGGHRGKSPEWICQISNSCSQMLLRFHDPNQVSVRIKVVPGSPAGVVAAEAKKAGANWVVLDKQLKQEEKRCIEELQCNIVVMKRSQPKILRLKLGYPDELQAPVFSDASSPVSDQGHRIKHPTPVSSPEDGESSCSRTTTGELSVSSSHVGTSPFFLCQRNPLFEGLEKGKSRPLNEQVDSNEKFTEFRSDGNGLISPSTIRQNVYQTLLKRIADQQNSITGTYRSTDSAKHPNSITLIERFAQFDAERRLRRVELSQANPSGYNLNLEVRDAVSLSKCFSKHPPLCSLCRHKSPTFGKPAIKFEYGELEIATDGFSGSNFIAQGKFGTIHRGVLRDGQVVAVKQLERDWTRGIAEFCREVSILSCAQHKNIVMLIGFCIKGTKRILVYEYICNGSLDLHLYGSNDGVGATPLDWQQRLQIAIGAARGLRYLHEDCRVGCIVHGDVQPNNILLTHDFEPLVGDFGLARWNPEWDVGSKPPASGAFGYLAPECIKGRKVTERADVYAFGVLLLELITGRRFDDLARLMDQKYTGERFPLSALEQCDGLHLDLSLMDRRLVLDSSEVHNFSNQLGAMTYAASLCLHRDPESRPPMSKVLKILEGGDALMTLGLELNSGGNRSGRMRGLSSQPQYEMRYINHSRKLSQ